jgi:hypothetical protein
MQSQPLLFVRISSVDGIEGGRPDRHRPPVPVQPELGVQGEYQSWPVQYGWWRDKRQHILTDEAKRKIA